MKRGWGEFSRLLGAGVACGALCLATPALARRVAIDGDFVTLVTPCTLGVACGEERAIPMPFPVIGKDGPITKLFIYDNGVVSLNKQLPLDASYAGGLASLGDSFLAPGFTDFPVGLLNVGYVLADDSYEDDSGPFIGELRINWYVPETFDPDAPPDVDPSTLGPIWGLSIFDLTFAGFQEPRDLTRLGDAGVSFGHGINSDSWGNASVLSEPYLPPGSLIGWRVGDQQYGVTAPSNLEPTGYDFLITADVPEPATWAMLLLGFAGLGAVLRYRRRASWLEAGAA